MLPFLRVKKADGGVITQLRAPDIKDSEQPEEDQGLEVAMKDLSDAADRKDHKAMAAAFKAAFDILESQPQEEYSDEESEE
jgi:hypothetical protein